MRLITIRSHFIARLLVALVLAPVLISGQDPAPPKPATLSPNQAYKIGIGDILMVRVFGHPELGGEYPVNNYGNIRLPFFEELPAACRSEFEVASDISEKLRKYLRNPQVDVVVKEYRSQPVSVIGAIVHPSRFQLQRRARLLEIIANAGGPSPNAGTTVFVIHNPEQAACGREAPEQVDKPKDQSETTASITTTETTGPLLSTYKLRDLMTGAVEVNHYVQPGDVISIPEADKVYITGEVLRPGAVALTGGLTLFTAISQAGGFLGEADKNGIRIIRPGPDGKRLETIVKGGDIEKRKIDDPLLQANDLIHVPSSFIKNVRKSLYQIVPSTVSALPILILP
jgi:polysaccharide export outer membrane protein